MKRRDFLKIAVVSSLAGIGGLKATDVIFAPGELEASITKAASGMRYAMVIDITKLAPGDYEKCARACHDTHNVPDVGNLKEEIKWIWNETYEHAFPGDENPHLGDGYKERPFLVLCNHCEHPPCVRVCPTKATFRRDDGIIMMDYHRCIGCRFCMAGCPFGARSFNWRDPRQYLTRTNPKFPTRTKGVVEKCNFCAERLAKDLEPACVEATGGSGAMIFGDLNDPHSGVREALRKNFSIRRKPELGTSPGVYYIIGGSGDAG